MPDIEIPAPQPAADQRHELRVALLIKKIKFDDERRVFFGYATNISRNGLFISSVNPAQLNSHFTVEMTLPAPLNQTVCCECETIWRRTFSLKSTDEPGMGLRFLDLDEETKNKIGDWIQQQSQESL